MTEHRRKSAQRLSDQAEVLRCVTLPAIPAVYGLEDPDEGVTAWMFALPGGQAYIVSSDEDSSGGVIDTSLDRVIRWWAPRRGTDLVLVAT